MQDIIHQHRTRLFRLAYRMLGSVSDAEDVVQEALLRFHKADRSSILQPASWLTTTVTRLCLDELKSARHQRETYMGVWLPEPLEDRNTADQSSPAVDSVELAQSLTLAFMQLLDQLKPVERAVYLLREAFDMDYSDIAATVDKSEPHCRQLLVRAKQRINPQEYAPPAASSQAGQWLAIFLSTCQTGDFQQIKAILAQDVTVYSDSGGQQRSLLRPIAGVERVAHFLLRIMKRAEPGQQMRIATVNGEPALVFAHDGQVSTVIVLSFREGRLWRLFSLRNPDKLKHLANDSGASI